MLFTWNSYQIQYKKWGNGPIPLLAFHGFGQEAGVWYNLNESLHAHFTVYAFSHFHHAKSKLPPGMSSLEAIPATDYTNMFEAFIKENALNNYWLMGYSLGGKSVVHLTSFLSNAPQGIILLAPDGITESGWYGFVSRTKLGEFIYKITMFKGRFFEFILNNLYRFKLINNSLYKFVQYNVGNKRKRAQVLFSWKSLANIRKANKQTYTRINEQPIKNLLILGKYDQVIDPRIGKIYFKNTGSVPVIWEAGHDLIKPKFNNQLSLALEDLLRK